MTAHDGLPSSYTLPPPEANPGEVERITYEDMRVVMRERFGDDPMDWAFQCPQCTLVQSSRDAEPLGPVAKEHIGRICLNCYRGTDDPARCTFTALTASGAPLTVTRRTTYGSHAQPSMPIAPAPVKGMP